MFLRLTLAFEVENEGIVLDHEDLSEMEVAVVR